jgi:hypothetical protein
MAIFQGRSLLSGVHGNTETADGPHTAGRGLPDVQRQILNFREYGSSWRKCNFDGTKQEENLELNKPARIRAGQAGNCGLIPCRSKDFFFLLAGRSRVRSSIPDMGKKFLSSP